MACISMDTNWLSKWKQKGVEKGCFSDWRKVCSDIPQGSILELWLFLIYINELDLTVSSTT